jgi:DHA2 family multidrug resistance protein
MLTRRTAAHENSMARNLVPGSAGFDRNVENMARMYKPGNGAGVHNGPFGGQSWGAIHQAQAAIYNQLHAQAATLAYVDIIRYLTIFCACMLPLLFFIPKAPKNMSVGH